MVRFEYWFLMAAVLIVGVTSCAIVGEPFLPPPEQRLQKLNNSDWVPHRSELDGQAMNIIWNIGSDVRDQLALTDDINEGIIHHLRGGGIQIKNPRDKKTRHLIEEIERARRNTSTFRAIGEQKVRYYVKGSLTRSSLSADFSDPVWCPFCDHKRPGSCDYKLASGLQIEVLSLPSLQRVKHFSFTVDSAYSVDAFDRCAKYSTTAESANGFRDSREEMLKDLVACSGKSLESFLSPQAYVEKYFSDGEEHIYQISSGSAAGLKKGDNLVVLRRSSVGVLKLGNGTVVSVQPYKAYMKVSDQELLTKIRLYDQVKVEYVDYTFGLGCLGVVAEH